MHASAWSRVLPRRFRRMSPLAKKMLVGFLVLIVFFLASAWASVVDGQHLFAVSTLNSQVTQPSVKVLSALQQERRAAMIYLARPTAHEHDTLAPLETRTDAAVQRFRDETDTTAYRWAAGAELRSSVNQARHALDGLASLRGNVDTGRVSRDQALDAYATMVAPLFAVFDRASTDLQGDTITQYSRTLNSLLLAN